MIVWTLEQRDGGHRIDTDHSPSWYLQLLHPHYLIIHGCFQTHKYASLITLNSLDCLI